MYLGYYLQFYLFYVQAKFWSYAFLTRLMIVISVSLILVLIINKLRAYYFEWKYNQIADSGKNLKERLENSITNMLVDRKNLSEQYVLREFESVYNIRGSRRGLKILSKLLIQASLKSRIGQIVLNDNNYYQILNTYGIINFWELELVSNNLNRIFKAKKNLDELKIGYHQQIQIISEQTLPHSKNRIEPISEIKHENYEPYKFLDESFTIEFNPLDEILVHQFLMFKAKASRLPLLSRWVRNATNSSFKIFMIKEIGFFKQIDCASILASLLPKEAKDEVRIAIIETLILLKYAQSETQIFSCYKSGNLRVKKTVINAIVSFKSKFGLDYLNEVFFETVDLELKEDLILAMKTFRNDQEDDLGKSSPEDRGINELITGQINYQIG